MEIQQLRYVVEVSRQGSFSAAAKALFVSQSAMSQQIQKLENDLGFQLFYRSTRNVGTTDAGLLFCRYAEKVIKAYEDLENGMSDYRFKMNNSLAVLYMSKLSHMGLTKNLSIFYDNNKGIAFSTVDCAEGDLEYKKESTHWDVLILRDSDFPTFLKSDAFVYDMILKDQVGVVCSKENPLFAKKKITLADLKNTDIVYGQKEYVPSLKNKDGSNAQESRDFEMSEDVAIELVRSGRGVALLPKSSAEYHHLSWVPLSPAKYDSLYYVTAKEKLKYEVVDKFISFLKQSYESFSD